MRELDRMIEGVRAFNRGLDLFNAQLTIRRTHLYPLRWSLSDIQKFQRQISGLAAENQAVRLAMTQYFRQKAEARVNRIWSALPEAVTEIEVDSQWNITRPAEMVEKIPPNERVTWNLQQVDDYGSIIAKRYRLGWKPIIT